MADLAHNPALLKSDAIKTHERRTHESSDESSMSSSIYDAKPTAAATGKTPFAPAAGDQTAVAYLTQCYEQLMKDNGNIHSDSTTSTAPRVTPPAGAAAAAAIGRMLSAAAVSEPQTYVFIFTNPRSGNQQGRSLLNMALHSFRLRERPEVQVQIYDITDKDNLTEGLHYIHQLQLRQGDRLLKTAFPELFDERHGIRPSPTVRSSKRRSRYHKTTPKNNVSAVDEADNYGSDTCDAGKTQDAGNFHNTSNTHNNSNSVHDTSNASADTRNDDSSSTGDTSAKAWEEWIGEAAAQLQSGLSQFSDEEVTRRLEQAQEPAIKLHVWSAGGDGTVSSTLEAMMAYGIDVGRLYFSSIPFGTGNDFADALGWGRSVPGDGVGESMKLLNKIITERLDGYTCKLDIYEVTITTYDDGHIKHVEKEMFDKPGMRRYTCLMIDYLSIGVQGFVGSSFELHRPGSRALNILMYTVAAAKWVFLKRFPPINEALESISTVPDHMRDDPKLTDADRALWLENASEAERRQVLLARVAGPRKRSHGRKMQWAKQPKARRTATARDFGDGVDEDLPVIQYKPIEIDIQNVARFWGRNIDVWDSSHDQDSSRLLSRTIGETDSSTWTPQYAGDGKLELFGVRNIGDYALNQLPARNAYRISRLAQMGSPVVLHFRAPENYPPRSRSNPLSSRRSIEQGLLYAMCDGEFIEMYHPRDIIISRKVTLKAVGRSPESSRIVLDTIKNDGLDAVQMDATASANKTHCGQPVDISSYVASPFQRIFGFGRRPVNSAAGPATVPEPNAISQSGSVLEVKSAKELLERLHTNSGRLPRTQTSSTSRHSTFRSIRNSILRSVHSGSSRVADSTTTEINSETLQDIPESETVEPPSLTAPVHSLGPTSAAVHKISPLWRSHSLSDIHSTSKGPDNTSANLDVSSPKANGGTVQHLTPQDNSASHTQSRSFDLNHGHSSHASSPRDGTVSALFSITCLSRRQHDKDAPSNQQDAVSPQISSRSEMYTVSSVSSSESSQSSRSSQSVLSDNTAQHDPKCDSALSSAAASIHNQNTKNEKNTDSSNARHRAASAATNLKTFGKDLVNFVEQSSKTAPLISNVENESKP